MDPISTKPQGECNVSIKLGMGFGSDEHAYECYNEYATSIGFSVRKKYANKNRVQGYVTSTKFTCNKEGYRNIDKRDSIVKKHRKETRTGCLAHIIISHQSNGVFHITLFEDKHNYPLVDPTLSYLLPSQRKIKVVQAYELDLLDDSGIRLKASIEYAARQAGGQSFLGYTKRDHKNYLRDKRQESLKHGLDDDSLITNVFWVDAKMIRDFKMYEDVVSFDTPYRTNKEYRPLALFVGLNNHSEMIIFGAAVLFEESTESFEWIFNAFFKIMSADKPQTFMTD
ncbi:hypothetical protein CQW23_01553 [Capsicum baccatum]|uniref:Uncharacterized protein n=1 Tax=Capsicum baccatum TaxID=33114 RepID=A0A2G2XNY9_CAPBA|nr:hypothetical protein CQW23_01553 [Capsicum baccatum]